MTIETSRDLLNQFKTASVPKSTDTATAFQFWSQDLVIYLCSGVLLLCFASMLLATWVLSRQPVSAGQVLRLFGILSIINITAVVLIAGYGVDQVSPIIGLFGAIAGYLIGKDTSPAQTNLATPTPLAEPR